MNKQNGDIFEQYIQEACLMYLDAGYAFIEKTPEAFHVIKNAGNGTFIGNFAKKCQPDFKGILCDGTCIVFEAKHTEKDRINQHVVTEAQWDNLEHYENFGAKCYVMVSLGFTKFYRVPWHIWKNMKSLFKHKYMNEEELKPYKVKHNYQMIHILDGIELKD